MEMKAWFLGTCLALSAAAHPPNEARAPAPTPVYDSPLKRENIGDDCKPEERVTTRIPLCPTYSCASISKTCKPGPTSVIESKRTTMTWRIDGCTTTLGVDWVPCSSCPTCTPGRATSSSAPPKPSTTRSASCFGDGKGRTKTEVICPSLFCAEPTADCSGKPTSVIKTITTTQTVVRDCTTTLRVGANPCPTCNTCKPPGASCTGPGKTIRQGLCPSYKCAVPTARCTKSTSSIKTITTTQTLVEGCTTTLRIGEQPCSTCKTCLDAPRPTLPVDAKREAEPECKLPMKTIRYDRCAAVKCIRPLRLCLPGGPPRTRTTTATTESCTVKMTAGWEKCCQTCTLRRGGGITLPVEPTALPGKREAGKECDREDLTTVRTDKCAVVRCAAPTKECLVAQPPRTRTTRTVTTDGCTVRQNVGYDRCCETCTGGPTAATASPPKPTKPPATPGYPPCRDTVTTALNDLCPQVRCLPPSGACTGELKTVTRTKRTETERVNPCTWALHTGWSPCAFCTPCEVPQALATANVYDEDKGLWIRVEGVWPTETPKA